MPTGRYAPSPTGTFHVGNLRTALAAWLFARVADSSFLLRWEDLDVTADPRHEVTQARDLAALGVEFDGVAVRQSERIETYDEVIAELSHRGLTYRCWCSRREIREAAAAPHGVTGHYPGTCRELTTAEVARHTATGRPPALRLRADRVDIDITDSLHGPVSRTMDDIVLRRGDGTPAYNLTVVVDDHLQGVGEVVRADDLLDSTPRHAYLQRVLGFTEPIWTHVPMVIDAQGDRLAKRDGSAGLEEWQQAGGTAGSFVAEAGRSLGIADLNDEATVDELLVGFDQFAVPLSPTVFDGAPKLSLAD
jgi:glutamyl-tRNA synthetase